MTESEIFVFDQPPVYIPPEEPFVFGVIGLAHAHIYSMCEGLIRAGAVLKYVYETDAGLLTAFLHRFPSAKAADDMERILGDSEIRLIASAAVPVLRADIALKAMYAGKDFFVDKAPLITIEQLEQVRNAAAVTDRRYFVYYSESLTDTAALFAGQLIRRGIIGRVSHVDGFAPHQLSPSTRAEWFFDRKSTGGILIDLVCHQIHQFLCWSGARDAAVNYSRTGNYYHGEYGDFDDFGDAILTADNGITGYFRVDWSSPDGLGTWGDSRMFIQGEKGYIELRKNCDICSGRQGGNVYVVTQDGQFHRSVGKSVPVPFFENLIRDCLYRTETAVPSDTALKAIELAIKAQLASRK